MSTQVHRIRVGQSEVYAQEQGEGSPTLVFLDYWGGSRRSGSGVITQLSSRHRCIAVDLRGWGKSGRHIDDYSLFAQMLAARGPDGLRSVVLVAPAPPTPLNAPEEQKRTMINSYTTPEGIVDALKVVSHRPLTLAQRLQVTEDSLGGALGAKITWVSQGMDLDISKQVASINIPVSVIAGSEDQVEKEAALRNAFLPLVPHVKFEIIKGVGHLSPLEAPDEVAHAISGFLATA